MKTPTDCDDKQHPPMPAPPWMRARSPATRQEPRLADSPSLAKAAPRTKPRDSSIDWPPKGATSRRPLRSLEPAIVPEPRKFVRPKTSARSLLQFSFYLWLAAIMCYGVVEMTLAYGQRPLPSMRDASVGAGMTPQLAAMTSEGRPATARLVVEDRHAAANEPLPLGVVLHGATGGEALVLTGFPDGTRLSAGEPLGPNGWRIPARELANVVAYPPASFVGVKDVLVELRSPDNASLDMQVARLEWTAKSGGARAVRSSPAEQNDAVLPAAATAKLAPDRTAKLIKRGLEFLKDGDFAAARLMLRPAADAGDAQAALLLGATFDPLVLAELGVFGLRPDPVAARAWYQRAAEFGSADASGRIDRLAQGK
jgi:hypothetical protein